jgi:sucrose-6-phosphatase
MSEPRLLLCTDMDRTIIPNGAQPENPRARKTFSEFCENPQVVLVYVTGRHQVLVQKAIKHYSLPVPDFMITDVGTKIYHRDKQQWNDLRAWEEEIDKDWNGKNSQELKALFHDVSDIHLQELSKQNTHKLSYYVYLDANVESLLSLMDKRLEEYGVHASLVWSVDEPRGIGLLDILPLNATKLHAIDFLRNQLGYKLNEVVFAGDSGNDLPVLESSIQSVLVANAANEVKIAARSRAEQNGNLQSLYIATGNNANKNGNYAAGVMEGVCHFVPAFRKKLEQDGFCYE